MIASFEVASSKKIISEWKSLISVWCSLNCNANLFFPSVPNFLFIVNFSAVHSLEKSTLGQYICSYTLDSDEILMSLSFSPSSEYLLVGVRSSKIFGCFLKITKSRTPNKTQFNPPQWINSIDNSEHKEHSSKGLIFLQKYPHNANKSEYKYDFFYFIQATIKSLCWNGAYPIQMWLAIWNGLHVPAMEL